MARSTKTKHVMDLVGAEAKKKPTHKPTPAEKVEKTPPVPKIVEAVISEAQQSALREEAPQKAVHETSAQTAPVQDTPAQETTEQKEAAAQAESVQAAPEPAAEERDPFHKPIITAIVCELINQELGSVAERFHLSLTDANLWALTRAALEEVRPEFSADSEDREEKLERLRPMVIGAMAKVAIKIASKKRGS